MRIAAAAILLALAAGSAFGQTSSGELTHPRAHPSAATRHTAFAVAFTLRHDAGHQGVTQTVYQVRVAAPRGARRACTPSSARTVTRGSAGTRRRVTLIAPTHGWCTGRYHATVWLQTGPYCPKPQPGQRPTPCPLFASREQATGTTRFTVRPASR